MKLVLKYTGVQKMVAKKSNEVVLKKKRMCLINMPEFYKHFIILSLIAT